MLETGIYQHYKGPKYEVVGLATHSETEEKLVVYRTLYGDFDLWVRPYDMFIEEVEYQGEWVQRFRFVSSDAS